MTKVIGVRFRNAGKVYYFAPGDLEITQGDHVIVETARCKIIYLSGITKTHPNYFCHKLVLLHGQQQQLHGQIKNNIGIQTDFRLIQCF